MRQSVYPNPTTGVVHLPQVENLRWQLFDATGRLVGEDIEATAIDLETLGLSEQTYSLRLIADDVQTTIKLVYLKN
jgi:hypothetical protein